MLLIHLNSQEGIFRECAHLQRSSMVRRPTLKLPLSGELGNALLDQLGLLQRFGTEVSTLDDLPCGAK